MKDIVAPYFDYVGITIIVSYTVTHHIRRHSRRLVREMLPVTEPGYSAMYHSYVTRGVHAIALRSSGRDWRENSARYWRKMENLPRRRYIHTVG